MDFKRDTEAEVFNKIWPGGYSESFEGYTNQGQIKYGRSDINALLSRF